MLHARTHFTVQDHKHYLTPVRKSVSGCCAYCESSERLDEETCANLFEHT